MEVKKKLIEAFMTGMYNGDGSMLAEDAIVQPPYGAKKRASIHTYLNTHVRVFRAMD